MTDLLLTQIAMMLICLAMLGLAFVVYRISKTVIHMQIVELNRIAAICKQIDSILTSNNFRRQD